MVDQLWCSEHLGDTKGILFNMQCLFTIQNLLSCTHSPRQHSHYCVFVCAGLSIEFWPVGQKRKEYLAWRSGHHWVPPWGRSLGCDLGFEQWKPHQSRQVRNTMKNHFSKECLFKPAQHASCFCVRSQEGVSLGKYSPLEVSVETDQGLIPCRTYQINNFHPCPPSPQYKRVCANKHWSKAKQFMLSYVTMAIITLSLFVLCEALCLGAEQNGLPREFLKKLQAIPTNNYSGSSFLDQILSVQPERSRLEESE